MMEERRWLQGGKKRNGQKELERKGKRKVEECRWKAKKGRQEERSKET